MQNNKIIAYMLCYLTFVLLSLFCHGSNLTKLTNATEEFFVKDGVTTNTFDRSKRRHRQRPDFMYGMPLTTHDVLVESYLNHPSTYRIPNPPPPFTEILVRDALNKQNKKVTIPLVLTATLKYSNLQTADDRRNTHNEEVTNQMIAMGREESDEAVHLLAYSLGGKMNNVWNYVSQVDKLHRRVKVGGKSMWYEEESYIHKFLQQNQRGSVVWSMVVVYDDCDIKNLRPLFFSLILNEINDERKRKSSDAICFGNNLDNKCFSDTRCM